MVDVRIGRIDITQSQLRARVFGGREPVADAQRPAGLVAVLFAASSSFAPRRVEGPAPGVLAALRVHLRVGLGA